MRHQMLGVIGPMRPFGICTRGGEADGERAVFNHTETIGRRRLALFGDAGIQRGARAKAFALQDQLLFTACQQH
jgi:hypothetical protein